MVIIGKYNKSVILTYIGGIFALFGMIFAIIDNLQYSLICLMLAGICDLFDGKIARMCKRTDIEKEFGKQIDSLVDVFSFVALPCVIAIKLFLNINIWLCIIMIFYLLSGIIRLAWFNIISSKEEAVKLVKETSITKFDSSVEVAMNLNLDTKKADQQLRGAIVLPKGTGKTNRVLVIAKGDNAKAAEAAGADYVGDQDYLDKIANENWFEFDTMIATPDMMPLLGKLGRVLGPKGLMPNPKTGTVTTDVAKAVSDAKAGRVEYRTDSFGNIHTIIGKVSFTEEDLLANLNAVVSQIIKIKPATVKGDYIKNISISSTMGPGIKIQINSFDK